LLSIKTDYTSTSTETPDKTMTINPVQSAMNLISSLTSILEAKNGRN
jgi:hypothetical protein